MKVARACEPASARLSLQAIRLSYFKNSGFTPSLQRNITLKGYNVINPKVCRDPGARVGKQTSTVNSLNDGNYYVNINFNVCLHNNNLFHILNEHVHMLWKKTRVQSVHN